VVKVSEEEAEFLFGPGTPAQHAARILSLGPTLVAITRGPGGSYLAAGDASVETPGFPVTAVDTTGAGDGFVAGLLSGLLDHGGPLRLDREELEQLGQFANAAGALVCLKRGAIPALPTREAVGALLSGAGAS
jgi:fructokinase